MIQGFSESGKLVESSSLECRYVLEEVEGRTVFYANGPGLETASMQYFGRLVCWAIRNCFNWENLLSLVPSRGSQEQKELKAKLLAQYSEIEGWVSDEIDPEGLDYLVYERIAELYSRLFPAYGLFEGKWNFISDNYYHTDPDWFYRRFHTAGSFRELLEDAFGTYRKDLARVASKASSSTIALLSNFTGTVELERIIELFEDPQIPGAKDYSPTSSRFDGSLKDLRQFNRFPEALKVKLIREVFRACHDEGDAFELSMLMEDTFLMMETVGDRELKRFRSDRSWTEVHNRAVYLASDENSEKISPIVFPRKIEELDGMVWNGHELKLLRTPSDFLKAGVLLKNCMGKAGYYSKAKLGDSYCFVILKDREVLYGCEMTFEADRWKLLQLSGPSNSASELKKSFQEEIVQSILNGERAASEAKPRENDSLWTVINRPQNGAEENLPESSRMDKLLRAMEAHVGGNQHKIDSPAPRPEEEALDFSCSVPRELEGRKVTPQPHAEYLEEFQQMVLELQVHETTIVGSEPAVYAVPRSRKYIQN